MVGNEYIGVDAEYLKELEEKAKKVDYYKGIIDGINMVADRKKECDECPHAKCLYEADRKTESNSEKPNDCDYAVNPSGDAWECSCYQTTLCEHQKEDFNPDGTINIVECKDEPQTEEEYINNLPWVEVGNGEQTERSEE